MYRGTFLKQSLPRLSEHLEGFSPRAQTLFFSRRHEHTLILPQYGHLL